MEHTKIINLQGSWRKLVTAFFHHEGRSDPQDPEMLRNYTIIDILSLRSVAAIKNFRLLSSE